jgi:hypothetical protein
MKGVFSTKMGKVDDHMEKNEVEPLLYTRYENELKMDQTST